MDRFFLELALDLKFGVGYISIGSAERKAVIVKRSVQVEDFVLDFDEENRLVGIEILNLERIPKE